ncbi:MAG: Gfo/Idh/MocA family oxidoreductase [Verrucomicrobiae bacterium]|nr:Gfo/Idh/MocA family oxidoreductase [Verrucomicrobiae bacterium]
MKIGLVGATKIWHGMTFAEMLNGYDEKMAEQCKWGPKFKNRVGGSARITHVWDENIEHARESSRICGIPNVMEKKEDLIGKVDAVLVADDCTLKHQRKAIPFLKAGIPTFIDKPLSPDIHEAEEIIKLARKHRAPLMSCSALRFARETKDLREGKDRIGDILTGFASCRACMGGLVFYGIHAVELLYSVAGQGVKSVQNLGRKKEDLVAIKYKDGRRFTVTAYENINVRFQLGLYGTEGHRIIDVTDSGHFYSEMLRNFVHMAETREEIIPLKDVLETIKTVVKGRQSANEGKTIPLS